MTVGRKIFLIMTVVIVIFLATAFLLVKATLENSSDIQDMERARENLTRVARAFENELRNLSRQAVDYSMWDDTYAFVQNPNPAYRKSNLVESTFVENDFQAMVFFDRAGRTVYAEALDPETGRLGPLPPALAPAFGPGGVLFDPPGPSIGRQGYLSAGEDVYLVISEPVLTSRGEGPAEGTVAVARRLDEPRVQALGVLVDLPLRFFRFSGDGVRAEVKDELARQTASFPTAFRVPDGGRIEAYGLFRDFGGSPLFVISVDRPRFIHAQYLQSLRTFLALLALFALTSLVISQIVISRLVASRLHELDAFVRTIGPDGCSDRRVVPSGRDEISRLGETVNGLCDALAAQANALRQDEETIKKSQLKYLTLFETSTDAVFLETLDGRFLDCNKAACDLLGYTKEELLMLRVEDILPEDLRNELPAFVQRLAEAGHLVVEVANRKKTGETIPVEASLRAVRIGDETLAVVYVRDLTSRKRAERIQSAVYRISEAASSGRGLEDVFALIHRTVTELIPTKNFYISLYDEAADLMTFPYFIDEHDPAPPLAASAGG